MSKYYSPSLNAFFDAQLHGERRILIVDDDAQSEFLSELTAREFEVMPERDYGDDRPLSQDEQDAIQAELDVIALARTALVTAPPLIEVDNANCLLPDDAFEISDALHGQMMAAQGEGLSITAGPDGKPVALKRAIDADQVLRALRRVRDKALAASDWTTQSDSPLTPTGKKTWATYRTALRGVPAAFQKALSSGLDPSKASEQVWNAATAKRPS